MKHGILAILTYVAAVLQCGAWFRLTVDPPAMQFLPIVFALSLFVCEGWQTIAWAAVVGLTSDCLRTGPMGIDMFCSILVAALSLQLRSDRKRDGRLRQLFWGTVWCFTNVLTATALGIAVTRQTILAMPLLRFAVLQTGQAVVVAVVGILVWNAVTPMIPQVWRKRRRRVS